LTYPLPSDLSEAKVEVLLSRFFQGERDG